MSIPFLICPSRDSAITSEIIYNAADPLPFCSLAHLPKTLHVCFYIIHDFNEIQMGDFGTATKKIDIESTNQSPLFIPFAPLFSRIYQKQIGVFKHSLF